MSSVVVDENGEFEFNLAIPANAYTGDELLEIRVLGVEDQDHIELVSQVGDLDYVIETADDNDIVSAENLLRLNVSPISTALAVQTQLANGEAITDWDVIQDIERSVLVTEVLELAADIVALSNLTDLETPLDQSILEVLTESSLSIDDSLTPILELNNFTTVDGALTENYLDLRNAAQLQNTESGFLTEAFVINNMTNLPIILTPEYIQGTHPNIFSANIKLNQDGTGEINIDSYLDFQGRLNLNSREVTWEVESGRLLIHLSDGFYTFINIFGVAGAFDFDNFEEVIDFIEFNVFFERLFLEFDVDATNHTIEVNAISNNERELTVVFNHTLTASLDTELTELEFDQEIPSMEVTSVFDGTGLIVHDTTLSFEVDDFANESWAIPAIESLAESSDRREFNLPFHDVFGFNSDGTSTPGLLSNETIQWSIIDGKLVIETINGQITITPLIETEDDIFVAVERINDLGEVFYSTDDIVKLEDDNIDQFGQDFIQPTFTENSALLWQTRVSRFSSPRSFMNNGQLTFPNVLGWGFPENQNNQVAWIRSDFSSELCVDNDSRDCFDASSPQEIEFNGSQIVLTRDTGFQITQREWNVLKYEPELNRVIVLELIRTEDNFNSLGLTNEPRINVIQLVDIAQEYSEEYADDPSLFQSQE